MLLDVIGTGSKGNCYILYADNGEALILDAGLPFAQVLPHIRDFRAIKGCLITHEHQDHCKCVKELAMRGIRLYASPGTIQGINKPDVRIQHCKSLVPFKCGSFTVMPFPTQHDTIEPQGFLIRCNAEGDTVLYATDTYYLKYTFPNVNYWIVECNYCDDSIYPNISRKMYERLMHSHMSLNNLKTALASNDLSKARKIVLVHLSDRNSDEERMVREIYNQTLIDTEAAANGCRIDFNTMPF